MSNKNKVLNVKKDKVFSNLNKLKRFKIIDKSGKVIEQFRTKRSAVDYINKNNKTYLGELSIKDGD
ncbi:MAG: hypothetical protein ACOC56_06645 [Atribacterota bacterium]